MNEFNIFNKVSLGEEAAKIKEKIIQLLLLCVIDWSVDASKN